MWIGCFPQSSLSFTPIQERNVHFKDREGTEHPKVLPREHVALVGSSGVGNLNLGGPPAMMPDMWWNLLWLLGKHEI